MNSKSVKNRLQEYCQKEFGDIPTYETLWVGYENPPKFKSKVVLPNGYNFESVLFSSKKEAEKAVASIAMKYIEGNLKFSSEFPMESTKKKAKIEKQYITCDIHTYVLIDLENYPQMNEPYFMNNEFLNVTFEAYVGKCSSHAQKNLGEIYPFIKTITIVNSVYKNAVDHFITMRVGHLLGLQSTPQEFRIIVVSRDAFAGTIEDCVKQFPPVCGLKECIHVISAKDCFKVIEKSMK